MTNPQPLTPKLTESQLRALRLCWLADRNPRHTDLVRPGSLGHRSYADREGHVITGADLTRYPTISKLKKLGFVQLVADFAVHITDAGRFAAEVYGFTE